MNDGTGAKKNHPKKALGRGLAALLGDDLETAGSAPTEPKPGEKIIRVPLERLEPNPFQPRKEYNQKALQVLADSIAEHGVLQPVVVRPSAGGYQLIAGERRMRASQLAGLTSVPAVVRKATDEQALLLALLENLQREDLNPLEEAKAYRRLADEFSLSQEEIAKGVGKERPTVTNSLRLLKLPREIQDDISRGVLSAGHARAILMLPGDALMIKARDLILLQKLSVRAAEKLVKTLIAPEKSKPQPGKAEIYIRSLSEDLSKKLGTKVDIRRKGKKGSITLEFYSDEELERLLELFG